MREITEGALSVFCPPTENRSGDSIEVIRELDRGDLSLRLDRDEMTRVFINLFKNAIQAMEGQGGTLSVSLTTGAYGEIFDPSDHPHLEGESNNLRSTEEVAVVIITDTGPGMEAGTAARVFEPNFSTKSAGTGLGLAICRRTITEMKGLIGLRTTPGHGCRFVVVLPSTAEGVITRIRNLGPDENPPPENPF